MKRFFSILLQDFLPWIVLIHSLLFILFWLTNNLFYSETNDFLAKMIGKRLDYISICLGASFIVGLWSAVRLLASRKSFKHRFSSLTLGLYLASSILYLAFFYGSFWMLFKESPVQVQRLIQMVSYFRLFFDAIILLGLSILFGAWIRSYISRKQAAGRKVSYLPVVITSLLLVILWAIAVINPPGSIVQGELPSKPFIIAHRGASMLAPENTLASANLAAKLGVHGLETDIHISSDGQPFLLHDDTFVRTTDVRDVFPGRASDRVEYFTLAEATSLNAGQWFVDRDPYRSIGSGRVSDSQVDEYLHQLVPTLDDELDIVRLGSLVLIFDLKQPPADQQYAESFFQIVLDQIHSAGVDQQIWFLADKHQSEIVRSVAPAMKLAYGVDFHQPPTLEELSTSGYQVVNAEYGLSGDWIHKYHQAGLLVNLYTIDEPWQYSRLWLLGVDSTTTSNAQAMIELDRPVMSVAYTGYLALWGLIGLLSLAIFLWITLPVYRHGVEKA